MAPSAARMPHLMPAPSNAGPAEQAQPTIHSALPMTISPLVPMSMKRKTSLIASWQIGAQQARRDVASDIAAHAGSKRDDRFADRSPGRPPAPVTRERKFTVGTYGDSRM